MQPLTHKQGLRISTSRCPEGFTFRLPILPDTPWRQHWNVSSRPSGLQKPASEERNSGMTELATTITVIVLFGAVGLLVVDYVSRRGR